MRVFKYLEQGFNGPLVIEYTEDDIIKKYYPYWCEQMRAAGKESLISFENCIEDFIVVNWAWEVKE